jgi:hypothetical protein
VWAYIFKNPFNGIESTMKVSKVLLLTSPFRIHSMEFKEELKE